MLMQIVLKAPVLCSVFLGVQEAMCMFSITLYDSMSCVLCGPIKNTNMVVLAFNTFLWMAAHHIVGCHVISHGHMH